jgi:hypothetical protein
MDLCYLEYMLEIVRMGMAGGNCIVTLIWWSVVLPDLLSHACHLYSCTSLES